MTNEVTNELTHVKFERYVIGAAAIVCAGILIAIALLGPLGFGLMEHRTSQSVIYQTMGQDLVGVLLMAPLLLIGGFLHIVKREGSKYFLILTPITLIYTGLSYGIGQEWSNVAYSGNIENYFGLFVMLIIGGLILGTSSLSMFDEKDAPDFNRRNLYIYAGLMSVFFLLFAMMWSSEVFEVIATGNTSSGSYASASTIFWTVRYLDLGITIPLGYMVLYLLITRPKQAYPIILLFFGFFITMGTAVNAMAIVSVLSGDPEVAGAAAAGLVIFPILGILAYAGLWYLIKNKIRRS
ncbi:hypothetical protein ES703_96020 [subsurface metagenome]